MTTRKPVSQMRGSEVAAVLDAFTPSQIREALVYLSGYRPEAIEVLFRRLDEDTSQRPRPRETGDDDEEPVPAWAGMVPGVTAEPVKPGECYGCHGHTTGDGVFHEPEIVVPAGALVTPHVVGAL